MNEHDVSLVLKSLLTANARALTLQELCLQYKESEGFEIPVTNFGYSNVLQFLLAYKDMFMVIGDGFNPLVQAVTTSKSAHIAKYVAKQKKSKPNKFWWYPYWHKNDKKGSNKSQPSLKKSTTSQLQNNPGSKPEAQKSNYKVTPVLSRQPQQKINATVVAQKTQNVIPPLLKQGKLNSTINSKAKPIKSGLQPLQKKNATAVVELTKNIILPSSCISNNTNSISTQTSVIMEDKFTQTGESNDFNTTVVSPKIDIATNTEPNITLNIVSAIKSSEIIECDNSTDEITTSKVNAGPNTTSDTLRVKADSVGIKINNDNKKSSPGNEKRKNNKLAGTFPTKKNKIGTPNNKSPLDNNKRKFKNSNKNELNKKTKVSSTATTFKQFFSRNEKNSSKSESSHYTSYNSANKYLYDDYYSQQCSYNSYPQRDYLNNNYFSNYYRNLIPNPLHSQNYFNASNNKTYRRF